MISSDVNEKPFFLFLSGNAGTGKSYLVRLLIEAIKEQQKEIEQLKKHSHPAKDMCDMNGYEELVARIEKMEKKYGNN